MQPNGIFLLSVGLISFLVVAGVAVFVIIRAWKLAKRGIRVSRVAGPLAAGLALKSEELTKKSYKIAQQGDEIAVNLEKLNVSLKRLQILLDALNEARAPWSRVLTYLGR